MERAGRPDADHPGLRGGTQANQGPEEHGDPVGELRLRVGEQTGQAAGPRGAEDAVLVVVELAGVGGAEEPLQVPAPEARIGHHPIELVQQQGLGECREVTEGGLGRVLSERLPIVWRALDRMLQQPTEASILELVELLPRPTIPFQHLHGVLLEHLGRERVDGDGSSGHVAFLCRAGLFTGGRGEVVAGSPRRADSVKTHSHLVQCSRRASSARWRSFPMASTSAAWLPQAGQANPKARFTASRSLGPNRSGRGAWRCVSRRRARRASTDPSGVRR